MSEAEKGAIIQQMARLPELLKAKAEGFVSGLAAASGMTSSAADAAPSPKGKAYEEKEVENG